MNSQIRRQYLQMQSLSPPGTRRVVLPALPYGPIKIFSVRLLINSWRPHFPSSSSLYFILRSLLLLFLHNLFISYSVCFSQTLCQFPHCIPTLNTMPSLFYTFPLKWDSLYTCTYSVFILIWQRVSGYACIKLLLILLGSKANWFV